METKVPTQSQVVIVGGGIIGCSIAFHLTKLGWRDVTVLERGTLTCGTTWHAAGLVMQLRASEALTKLSCYGADLYDSLEAETGQPTGFKRSGSLPIALTEERFTEIKRMASLGKLYGVDAEIITPSEVKSLYPLIDESKLVGGVYIPSDGQTNPIDTTMALAKGARMGGAKIIEGVSVTGFDTKGGRIRSVETDQGTIACDHAVICAGIWSRPLGKLAGVTIPSYPAEHLYVVTDPIEGLGAKTPVLRHADGTVYIKEDAGKMLIGCFEPNAKPLPLENLPARFEFGELPEDWDQFAVPMQNAIDIVPALENAGIRQFMNGPESFTPDNKFIVGETPEVRNLFVATGFNSQGILSGAGAGKAISEWIVEGVPTMDLSEIDIARFHRFQLNRRYLHDRTTESLGLLYAMHWPHRQVETARPVRKVPLYHRLKGLNACFGEAAGWERANWFAPPGVKPEYEYSYGRQNWFEPVRQECAAVRNDVGILDMSSFAKYLVQGRDAERALQYICANDVAVPVGKVVYTAFLNDAGGFESDLTVTRMSETEYLVVTAAASQNRDLAWIRRNIGDTFNAVATDVTSGMAVLSVMGPKARILMQRVSPNDFSNDAFPFGTAQEIEIGYAVATALRVTFVGELGWELYVPTEFVEAVYDTLLEAGQDLGVKPAGYHALDSLRLEKGYRHWGHDIGPTETPLEAGLGFAVSLSKADDFKGRSAIERQKQAGIKRRLVHLKLQDEQPILLHDEAIFRNGKIVGQVTSGGFGYTADRSVGLGYVAMPDGFDRSFVETGDYEIEIAGEMVAAEASLKPFYDPTGSRIHLDT